MTAIWRAIQGDIPRISTHLLDEELKALKDDMLKRMRIVKSAI